VGRAASAEPGRSARDGSAEVGAAR